MDTKLYTTTQGNSQGSETNYIYVAPTPNVGWNCGNCKFWKESYRVDDGFGYCDNNGVRDSTSVDGLLYTKANFGCVHFEAK